MIVAAQAEAAEVGASMLRQAGNAIRMRAIGPLVRWLQGVVDPLMWRHSRGLEAQEFYFPSKNFHKISRLSRPGAGVPHRPDMWEHLDRGRSPRWIWLQYWKGKGERRSVTNRFVCRHR